MSTANIGFVNVVKYYVYTKNLVLVSCHYFIFLLDRFSFVLFAMSILNRFSFVKYYVYTKK